MRHPGQPRRQPGDEAADRHMRMHHVGPLPPQQRDHVAKHPDLGPQHVAQHQPARRFQQSADDCQGLIELVRLRASQLNGCAYCVDMHSADARSAGVSGQRLDMLPVWADAPFYTAQERAALALTEYRLLSNRTRQVFDTEAGIAWNPSKRPP